MATDNYAKIHEIKDKKVVDIIRDILRDIQRLNAENASLKKQIELLK